MTTVIPFIFVKAYVYQLDLRLFRYVRQGVLKGADRQEERETVQQQVFWKLPEILCWLSLLRDNSKVELIEQCVAT